MQTEVLGGAAYKITLSKEETETVPINGSSREMRRFVNDIIDRLCIEQDISLPDGRLLVEAFIKSDGSSVFFVSSLEKTMVSKPAKLYSCDVFGADTLRLICRALKAVKADCSVYCGSDPQCYRIVFANPDRETERICLEFGEYGEISPLFLAQTKEYLTEIAEHGGAEYISDILG